MAMRIIVWSVALAIGFGSLGAIESFLATGRPEFFPTAEAIVGRPLTPVSVAGVTRRTVRRCAATVYVC
jgi:hypothetical protein